MEQTRYFLELAYNGTAYHGWQIQPNAKTVQEVLNHALSLILGSEISVVGCGRTDTGVHAKHFIAHFEHTDPNLAHKNLVFKLNRFLPKDIALFELYPVKPDIHSRFSAIARTYQYTIARKKDPFSLETAYLYEKPLDVKKMNLASKVLFDYEDFTSFSKLHTDVKTNNCNIQAANWMETTSQLIFTIKADRFLRNMVRAIVGTLLDVGKQRIDVDQFRAIIEAKDRGLAGTSAPAQGLALTKIDYPDQISIDY